MRGTPLPVEVWPEPDRRLWMEARIKDDLLDDCGVAADWRPATLRLTEHAYGTWLAWLRSGGILDGTRPPLERVTDGHLKNFIMEFGEGRSDFTVAGTVHHFAEFLRVTHPDQDVSRLSRIGYRLMGSAKPKRAKVPRLVPIAVLIDLGEALMREGHSALGREQVSGAPVYRDGLMIALLAHRPIRLRNLAGLQLGRTLLQLDDGAFRIDLPGSETKNHQPITVGLPATLSPWLERYVAHVRPVLRRRSSDADEGWLWIGRRGQPMAETGISQRISAITKRRLGRALSPHLFRDCAATDVAVNDSKHVGIIKSLLGHTTLATSQRYYNQAASVSAARKLDAAVARLRKLPVQKHE